MALSRNKIRYLASLKIKKYRSFHGQFIAEGDKIVCDMLENGNARIRQIIATEGWLKAHPFMRTKVDEIAEAAIEDIARISSLESPVPVMAVLDIPEYTIDKQVIADKFSLVLDNIQDPGNLGTIIRTADWFGIRHIICSEDCVDCFNPKVVQASMGALLNVRVCNTYLPGFLAQLPPEPLFGIYGTFMEGKPVFDVAPVTKGVAIFGNESKGISEDLLPYVRNRITIPPVYTQIAHVESLNVASAVAIVCAVLTR